MIGKIEKGKGNVTYKKDTTDLSRIQTLQENDN